MKKPKIVYCIHSILCLFIFILGNDPVSGWISSKMIEPYLERGISCEENGQIDDAIEYYTKAINLSKKLEWVRWKELAFTRFGYDSWNVGTYAFNLRGIAYMRKKLYDQAIADFNEMIKRCPNIAACYRVRGHAYQASKRYDLALYDFNKVIELTQGSNKEVHYDIASCYSSMNNAEESCRWLITSDVPRGMSFKTTIESDTDFDNIRNATCYKRVLAKKHYYKSGEESLERKLYSQAMEDFNKAIELGYADADVYAKRGFAYAKQELYDQAIDDFTQAIKLEPLNHILYNNRSVAYYKKKLYGQANDDLKRTIELNPEYKSAYYNKACCYSLMNNPTEACIWLNLAIGKGFKDWKHIKSDKDLDNIRNVTCYREIMAGK